MICRCVVFDAGEQQLLFFFLTRPEKMSRPWEELHQEVRQDLEMPEL